MLSDGDFFRLDMPYVCHYSSRVPEEVHGRRTDDGTGPLPAPVNCNVCLRNLIFFSLYLFFCCAILFLTAVLRPLLRYRQLTIYVLAHRQTFSERTALQRKRYICTIDFYTYCHICSLANSQNYHYNGSIDRSSILPPLLTEQKGQKHGKTGFGFGTVF